MALNSITVANGADIEGRLLARNGNVTLINDTISVPTCTTPSGGDTGGGGNDSDTGGDNTVVPGLPNTGISSGTLTGLLVSGVGLGVLVVALFVVYRIRKNNTV